MVYANMLFPFFFQHKQVKNAYTENSCLMPILSFNIEKANMQ